MVLTPIPHLLSCFSNTVTAVLGELSQSFRSVSQSFQSFCHSRFRHTVTEVLVTVRNRPVRVILDTYLIPIMAELPLPRLCCLKGRPAFRDRITRGSLESEIVYREVVADLEKPKKTFSAHNKQGGIKRGEKWFQEKL